MSKYKNMSYREEIKKIYEVDGARGFTRGWTAMLFRDGPGFGVYFSIFEYYKRALGVEHLEADPESTTFSIVWRKFFCGGFAGITTWTAVYPMDLVKSRM